MTHKVWIDVDSGDGREPQRVVWYIGTSDLMVENAIRMHFHLPSDARFLLRDEDGDLVPVSSTVPHDHRFQLAVVDHGSSSSMTSPTDQLQRPQRKRRRGEQHNAHPTTNHEDPMAISNDPDTLDHNGITSHVLQEESTPPADAATNPHVSPLRPRTMVYLIMRFLETFTCAIPIDDNISFIPNTGPYALYALYCHLFPNAMYHPKSQNSFYKMTSTQGKIDRQRVTRYYRALASRTAHDGEGSVQIEAAIDPYQYVVCRPEGKGPLLRKYVEIGTDVSPSDLARAAAFVQGLNLDPKSVIAQYVRFLDGFLPISKTEFQAHTKPSDRRYPHLE